MRFRYLKDPLFLLCVAVYFCNKLWRLHDGGTVFQNAYVNDLLCIPFWVPIMLAVNRLLRLRRHDGPPEFLEIAVPLVVWAAAFEIVFPYSARLAEHNVGDPNDILCYLIGALVAGVSWRCYYGNAAQRRPAEAA